MNIEDIEFLLYSVKQEHLREFLMYLEGVYYGNAPLYENYIKLYEEFNENISNGN